MKLTKEKIEKFREIVSEAFGGAWYNEQENLYDEILDTDTILQNQKLRELIEKEIEGLKPQINELTNFVHPEINSVYFTLRHLLEESKK